MRRCLASLLVVTLAAAAPAQPTQPDAQELTAANMARGDLLYAYDQSAWHVTDAALAALPDDQKSQLRGYITTPAPNGFRTTFYGDADGLRFKIYAAVWTGSGVTDVQIFASADKIPVSEEENRLIAAREIATRNVGDLTMCSNATPNAAVIPGPTATDPISVYVMTPQTKAGSVPMGGHHRIDVKDGKVVAQRKFTNSCISLDYSIDRKAAEQPVALFITHLLDPIPTEIHAFTVHATGIPLGVATKDGSTFWIGLRGGKAFAEKDKESLKTSKH